MTIHDATEQAYKNGYEAGCKEFAEELINRLYIKGDMVEEINNLVKEITKNNQPNRR